MNSLDARIRKIRFLMAALIHESPFASRLFGSEAVAKQLIDKVGHSNNEIKFMCRNVRTDARISSLTMIGRRRTTSKVLRHPLHLRRDNNIERMQGYCEDEVAVLSPAVIAQRAAHAKPHGACRALTKIFFHPT
jgi:hypothetical protein